LREGGVTQESSLNEPALSHSYAVCREIARREAKNFYYAFIALPTPRRNAICAIYAFMRKADDLSDDESISREERRKQLDAWLSEWRSVSGGAQTSDPVFVAVRDATARFAIPLSLLEELVAGVTMDLDRAESGAPDTYATFADLYRYCYLVASVVGLVCIRIFGYTDPQAEKLAEETGIAFQLTNILRDVAEDAERNRVYLPIEDQTKHGIPPNALLHRSPGTPPSSQERALLMDIANRAEKYYRSAEELMPFLDAESRPAMRVLVDIYHALLKRIKDADYDVFSHRASVPLRQKLAILISGVTRMMWARMFA
jgi:phytoene synthase